MRICKTYTFENYKIVSKTTHTYVKKNIQRKVMIRIDLSHR